MSSQTISTSETGTQAAGPPELLLLSSGGSPLELEVAWGPVPVVEVATPVVPGSVVPLPASAVPLPSSPTDVEPLPSEVEAEADPDVCARSSPCDPQPTARKHAKTTRLLTAPF